MKRHISCSWLFRSCCYATPRAKLLCSMLAVGGPRNPLRSFQQMRTLVCIDSASSAEMRRALKEARSRTRLLWQTTVAREHELKVLASLQSAGRTAAFVILPCVRVPHPYLGFVLKACHLLAGLSGEGQERQAASARLSLWMLGLGAAAAWSECHCEPNTVRTPPAEALDTCFVVRPEKGGWPACYSGT